MPDLLSIITVNLNDASGLRATAESVAGQEQLPDEWIVVDGGSSDGSIEVIRQFEPWIASWTSRPDRGVYDGMNCGLQRARGRYVMFMNAGDRLARPDTLVRIAAPCGPRRRSTCCSGAPFSICSPAAASIGHGARPRVCGLASTPTTRRPRSAARLT